MRKTIAAITFALVAITFALVATAALKGTFASHTARLDRVSSLR